MKKIFTAILLLTLCAPFLCTYTYLQYKKHQIKKAVKWQMIAGIDHSLLDHMSFHIQDAQRLLNWKHDKEFEYEGEWYDVVIADTINDTIYYKLWWDKEETLLNQQLTQLLNETAGNSQENKENNKRLSIFMKSLFFNQVSNEIYSSENESNIPSFFKFALKAAELISDSPPPDIS